MGKIDILQMAKNVVTLSKYLSKNDISDECVTYCVTAFIRQYIIECFDQEGDKENGRTFKDSGARREFDTGARRDISEGGGRSDEKDIRKGRCDLLPLDVVGRILSSPVLRSIEEFKTSKNVQNLEGAIFEFLDRTGRDIWTVFLETSIHFEDGARKYGENNWKKGIPLHCYIDSAVRHYLKFLRGDTDEPHDRAFVWNIVCAIWTFNHMPELDDVELDLKAEPSSEAKKILEKIASLNSSLPIGYEFDSFGNIVDAF